jgi:hypothetical protein
LTRLQETRRMLGEKTRRTAIIWRNLGDDIWWNQIIVCDLFWARRFRGQANTHHSRNLVNFRFRRERYENSYSENKSLVQN